MAEILKAKEVIEPEEIKEKKQLKGVTKEQLPEKSKVEKEKKEPEVKTEPIVVNTDTGEEELIIKNVLKVIPSKEEIEKMGPLERFASLKTRVRQIVLRKSKSGYNNRYTYIPLKNIQLVFTNIEYAYGFTSIYSQERIKINEEKFFVDAVRKLINFKTGNLVAETRIDITDLVINKIEPGNERALEYLERILQIADPKDAWKMIFLNYFDPQQKGSFSTYFQRYTYFQLYDFQEADYDDIEEKPQGKEEGKKSTNADFKSKKDKRKEDDEASKLRVELKESYSKEEIIRALPTGKKFAELNTEELKTLETNLVKKIKQGDEN